APDVPPNAVVRVRYSRAIDPSTVGSGSVTLTEGGTPVSGTASVGPSDTVAFSPSQPLAPGVSHTITIEGVADLVGGRAPPFARPSSTSGTPYAAAPAVIVASPPDGTVVGTNALVSIAFDERVDPLSVTGSTVVLHDALGPVNARLSVFGAHLQVEPLLP